jgi:hypothetical protein
MQQGCGFEFPFYGKAGDLKFPLWKFSDMSSSVFYLLYVPSKNFHLKDIVARKS